MLEIREDGDVVQCESCIAVRYRARKDGKVAGLELQKGSLWHAHRRKWATERNHLPDVDVATAGGRKTVTTLKSAYQQADAETMLRVVLEAGALREAK